MTPIAIGLVATMGVIILAVIITSWRRQSKNRSDGDGSAGFLAGTSSGDGKSKNGDDWGDSGGDSSGGDGGGGGGGD